MRKKTLNLFLKNKLISVPYVQIKQNVINVIDCRKQKYGLYKKNYKIIRPFLNCSRSFITKSSEQLNLPVYPDKSNQIVQYSRNRIRKQIIPSLKIFFNPQVEDAIFRFAEHILNKQDLIKWYSL